MIEAVGFTFHGRLDQESFLAFARHRAARLDLKMAVGRASNASVSVAVSGEAALVDAFEMACSLGPYDCIVLDVERTAPPTDFAN